jgi:hypothetical protein
LRFDLKRRTEAVDDFHGRLSALEAEIEDIEADGAVEQSYWLLGPKAVQAGSLHCDLCRGHGIDLASHDHIAIYPVGGWWKSHLGQQRHSDTARYSLAISITAEGHDVDLYSEIKAEVDAANIEAEVEL